MNTYEGICRYCGDMKLIIAESQEAADNIISAGCSCGGADEDQKIKKICENAKEIAEGLEPIITDILCTLGALMPKEVLSKVTLDIGHVKITAQINSKGQVKFKRKETKEKELQD